jgi:hypothetical protein
LLERVDLLKFGVWDIRIWRVLQYINFIFIVGPCTWGDPKISGIVTKIYLKYSYKFETLVTFKVLPLWLDAAIPVMLPLLETLSKTFNRNAFKGRQWFSLNLCNVSTTPPFQNLLHPWVKKKSQGARSGE